jgi:hypothetical protein
MYRILIVHDWGQLNWQCHWTKVLQQLMVDLVNGYSMKRRFLHRENEDVNEVFHNEDY